MPTYILGINAFHADAAAVLLRDGEVVAAIAEERLNRVKHFAGFPEQAVRMACDMAGIGLADIDHVAIGRDGKANLLEKLEFSARNIFRLPRLAKQRLQNRADVKDIPALVAGAFGQPRSALRARVHNIEHHLCHAASTYLVSPFEEAAIMTIDGFGDFTSLLLAHGRGDSFKVLDRVHFPHSLGIFYSAFCQLIGYTGYGDEGKVMGLAPYGEPSWLDDMRDVVRTTTDGLFTLDLDYFVHHSQGHDYGHDEAGRPYAASLYSPKMVERFGAPRVKGAEITQRDKDIARSMQARLEEVYFHVLRGLHMRVRCDALCVAGGVALNSVANGKLFRETPFRRFYAHPAATDDGTAFGAAYFVHNMVLKRPRATVLNDAYLGNEFSNDQIAAALDAAGLLEQATRLEGDQVYTETAKRIADGKVVGWFQGRMEWGPRALGARSILAHPGLPDMKDTLNARIKHREPFRPFAPSILEERQGDYFDQTWPAPFMMQVYGTKPDKRADIQACDHVDHTGRLQTVNAQDNPRYHALIKAFEAETGIPVVLNTSFNENEPIVCRPEEAIDCYQRTKMDVLVIGDWFLEKAGDA